MRLAPLVLLLSSLPAPAATRTVCATGCPFTTIQGAITASRTGDVISVEPGTGEVNWPFVFRRIDEMGFGGWIGCEYRPAGATEDGLGWFAPYRA